MLKYYVSHIKEELDGAIDYMTKAVEKKGTQCGESFRTMAMMEVEHANNLLKMFRNSERPKTITDADYAEMSKSLLDTYTDSMNKLESLKKMYWTV